MIVEQELDAKRRDNIVLVNPPGIDDIDLPPIAGDSGASDTSDESRRFLARFVEAARQDVRRYPQSAKPYIVLAQALSNAGDYDEAADNLEKALALEPVFQARYALAWVRLRQGNLMLARSLFNELANLRPRDSEPRVALASIALDASDLQEARYWAEQAIAIDTNDVGAHIVLGNTFLRLKLTDRAIGSFKAATRIEMRSAVAHYSLGIAYAVKGDTKRAALALKTCLAVAPRMAEAVHVLSRLLLHEASLETVIELLNERLEHDRNDYQARDLLAQALLRQHNYAGARRQLNLAYHSLVGAEPPDKAGLARVANNLGVCYERTGDLAKAEHYFWLSTQHGPETGPVGFQNLIRVRLHRSDLEGAEEVLREAEGRYPSAPRLQYLRGLMLCEQDKLEEAVEYLQNLLAAPTTDQAVFMLLASALGEDLKRHQAAIEVLTAAEQRFGRSLFSANLLAYVHLMSGNVPAAQKVLSESYEGEDESAVMIATRGLLRLKLGDIEGGEAGYRQAAELARRQGNHGLRDLALQKMHLELAREFIRRGVRDEGRDHLRRGLALPVKRGSYAKQLRELQASLQ